MKINNTKDFRIILGIKEDLDYLIERLEETQQDYVQTEALKIARDHAEEDLKKFSEIQKSKCEELEVGNIIRITTSDGISYSQNDYYLIKKIGISNIEADLISVTAGDYLASIKKEIDYKIKKEEFIEKYNRNSHKLVEDVKEWYDLEKYLQGLPFKD